MAKIKVSQATIDNIKKMGMTKALAGASKANPEMKEALTRMYGARRVLAAGGSSKPVATSADAARSGAMKKAAPAKAKSADAARSAATSKAAPAKYKSADAARMGVTKKAAPAKKKSGTTDPFAKFVFGAGRAAAEPFTSKPKPKK